MRHPLPTPREIRGRLIAVRKAERQAAFDRRLKCRSLIFGKGNGYVKNLSDTERAFCHSVWAESYRLYLEEFHGARPRYQCGVGWRKYHDEKRLKNPRRKTPMTAKQHRLNWIHSQKARWIRFDVPRMMKRKVEEMRDVNAGHDAQSAA